MKLTALLLAPLAMAATLPPPGHHSHPGDHTLAKHEAALVEPRGIADDIRTKKRCESMFKSDKTPYVNACAGEPDQNSMNLRELRALLGDASVECRAALMKKLGF